MSELGGDWGCYRGEKSLGLVAAAPLLVATTAIPAPRSLSLSLRVSEIERERKGIGRTRWGKRKIPERERLRCKGD